MHNASPPLPAPLQVSSQYLTALLMAAPLALGSEGIEIKIKDELISQPYVDMTVKLMERFGVKVGAGGVVRGQGGFWRSGPGSRWVLEERFMVRVGAGGAGRGQGGCCGSGSRWGQAGLLSPLLVPAVG